MIYFFSWPTIIIYSLIVIVISLTPIKVPEQIVFPFFDKVTHFFIYSLLSFITVNTLYLKKKKSPHLVSFFYAFSLGFFIEITHYILPFRDFELTDILANFLGSLGGCLLRIV